MEFLGRYSRNHKCSSPTPLPVFSKEQPEDKNQFLYRINGIPLNTGHNAADAFDGNYDTYVTTSSVGMDFGTPVQINRIRFVPRTANNGIVPGDSYALFIMPMVGRSLKYFMQKIVIWILKMYRMLRFIGYGI